MHRIGVGHRNGPSRCRSRYGIAAALLFAWLGGCDGGLSHRSYAEGSGRFAVDEAVKVVRIEIANGTVQVDRSDAPEVTWAGGVRRGATTAEGLASLEQIVWQPTVVEGAPGSLLLRGPAPLEATSGDVLALEIALRVPPTVELEIAVAGNGHVTVANRAARTRVETGRGDLRFENCSGDLGGRTGRGYVIAFGHRGSLDVDTRAGDMQAFVEEPGALIRLVTGQGTVQCQVPADASLDVDARAEQGKIGNGFGLEVQRVGTYGAALVGKVGSARTKVVLRTGSGHLSIAPQRLR
ncbi:MAG: hypothetical protein JNK78_19550 [Planctomycetes bacterium]|nr:hypothetical protein [Planctomycetota bacterium]